MFSRRTACALGLLLLALATPGAAASSWVRVQSGHFVVSANVAPERAVDVAVRLEQFRELLLRLYPGATLAVRPLVVVAFDSEKAFLPFAPLRDGRPAPGVAGYYAGNTDGGCIALQIDRGEESYPIVFHEYAHLFIGEGTRSLPAWFSEGVAEYYSTVELRDDGQHANIGRPVSRHIALLQRRFMPLRELLTATRASELWGNRDQVALFYAESWALVHYLWSLDGGPDRIGAMLRRLTEGRSQIEALEESFGDLSSIERALRAYVRYTNYKYWSYSFDSPGSRPRAAARPMDDAEVEAVLGTILAHLGRYDEAMVHVNAALGSAPGLPEAHVAMGLVELRRGRSAEAERALRAAVAGAPENLEAAYYWGLSLLERHEAEAETLEKARAALAAAMPATDPPADALAVLGILQGQVGRLDEAEASLRRSLRLAPGRTRTLVGLADVLTQRGTFGEARALLQSMLARPSYPGEADLARQQLEWLGAAESRARERAELALAAGSLGPSTPPSPAGVGPRPGVRYIPEYRQLREGEQRQLGLFEGVECRDQGVLLLVRTATGRMRFFAATLTEVQFITYRDDLSGTVGCRPRAEAEPVYLTWEAVPRGAAAPALGALAGRAIAVEFLPREYLR